MKRMQRGVCKDVILQGPSGHLWHVNLRCANTLPSFTDGWESFIYDQFIEPGDVLGFKHVDDVHFIVQIFGPSGCEKLSTFSFQNYTSCCFRAKNLNLSTICNKKRCEHRQNFTTVSVSLAWESLTYVKIKLVLVKKIPNDMYMYRGRENFTTTFHSLR